MIRRVLGFIGIGAQREILSKTLGKPLKDDRLKALAAETWNTLLWACVVIGERCFPKLKGKRFLKIHLAGLAVLLVATIIPVFMAVRAGQKLLDFTWINARREQAREERVKAAENVNNSFEGETNEPGSTATD